MLHAKYMNDGGLSVFWCLQMSWFGFGFGDASMMYCSVLVSELFSLSVWSLERLLSLFCDTSLIFACSISSCVGCCRVLMIDTWSECEASMSSTSNPINQNKSSTTTVLALTRIPRDR
jgi:hypothetical protein